MWIGRAHTMLAAAVIVIAAVAYGTIYAMSERMMARVYDVPLSDYTAPMDHGLLAEGERLARIGGCIGCHGPAMEGYVFLDDPWLARIVAPDLTRIAQEYSDAELERVIRKGVRRDGRTVWVMPSPMFAHLADDDLGAIIAYIRSVAPHNGPDTEFKLGPLGRIGVVLGEFPPLVAEIPALDPPTKPDISDAMAFGRYLALTACSECHGANLRGAPDGTAPPLSVVVAYAPDAFRRLMQQGIASGERELGLMSNVARDRFSHFRDDELAALYVYLKTLMAAGN
jgi:mono/diheme cytochrome c family protein